MVKYNPDLEPTSRSDQTQPNGVSEDPRNDGWGHRSEMQEPDEHASVTSEVLERRHGKKHLSVEDEKNRHEHEQQHRPRSDNHGETCANDYEFDRELSRAEKAAMQYGKYWSIPQKRRFITNKTDLPPKAFGWDLSA